MCKTVSAFRGSDKLCFVDFRASICDKFVAGVDRAVNYSTEHLKLFRENILPPDSPVSIRVVNLNKRCRSHLCQVFLSENKTFKTPNVLQICRQKGIIPNDDESPPMDQQIPTPAPVQNAAVPEPESRTATSMTPASENCNERMVNGVGPPTSTPKQGKVFQMLPCVYCTILFSCNSPIV